MKRSMTVYGLGLVAMFMVALLMFSASGDGRSTNAQVLPQAAVHDHGTHSHHTNEAATTFQGSPLREVQMAPEHDHELSNNDTFIIAFDAYTNEPGGLGVQDKAAVDSMFTFSDNLGADYTGQWTTPYTFENGSVALRG